MKQLKEKIMWKSDCCDFDVKAVSADEGTTHWECTKCKKICNAHNPNLISRQSKENCPICDKDVPSEEYNKHFDSHYEQSKENKDCPLHDEILNRNKQSKDTKSELSIHSEKDVYQSSEMEEFDKKLRELNTTQDFTNDGEGKVYEFGYKVIKDDEIFTIVDWDNIKKFISQNFIPRSQAISDKELNKLKEKAWKYDELCK